MNNKRRNLYQHLKKKHKISMLVRKDGTASCVVEPNADVTVVSSSPGRDRLLISLIELLNNLILVIMLKGNISSCQVVA